MNVVITLDCCSNSIWWNPHVRSNFLNTFIQLVEYVIIRWYGMRSLTIASFFFLMSMQSLTMSPPPRLGESKCPRSEEFTFPLRESLSIDRAWLSAASMDLAISLAFWSVSLPLTASSFLRRSCDRHLSINWSRTFSSSLVLQFSLSWNNLVTNWSVVSDSSCFAWRNWCCSNGMLTCGKKCASSNLIAFAYCVSPFGAGPRHSA